MDNIYRRSRRNKYDDNNLTRWLPQKDHSLIVAALLVFTLFLELVYSSMYF